MKYRSHYHTVMVQLMKCSEILLRVRTRRRCGRVMLLIIAMCLLLSFKIFHVMNILLLSNISERLNDSFSSHVAQPGHNENKYTGESSSENPPDRDEHVSRSLVSSSECNKECTRFHKMMSQWKSNKPKAAIYYLTRSDRIELLTISLASVGRHFLRNFSYPVIIFHESNFNSALRSLLQTRSIGINLFFQEVTFEIPPYVNASSVVFNIDCLSHISYRHMCRFQAKGIYDQPILNGLEYVWRLDDDSQLLDTVHFDVFEFMHSSKLEYGYLKIWMDSMSCTQNLWEAVNSFIRAKGIKPTFFGDWPEPRMYYNNFEISALSIWRSPNYIDYIDYIDRLGGIFYHRWGDAPIKSIAVSLFVLYEKTHLFNDIAYRHGNFIKNASYSSF